MCCYKRSLVLQHPLLKFGSGHFKTDRSPELNQHGQRGPGRSALGTSGCLI